VNSGHLESSDLTRERSHLAVILAFFGLMAALAGVDIVSDLGEGAALSHVFAEGLVLGVGFGAVRPLAAVAGREGSRSLAAEGAEPP